jgi:hypothetical protein
MEPSCCKHRLPCISCFAKRALCAPANIQQSVHVVAWKISRWVALVLQLLDEIEALRTRINALESG